MDIMKKVIDHVNSKQPNKTIPNIPLYLVKSDSVKARYFFVDEAKATELYQQLKEDGADVVLKYLKTSDEWSVDELVQHFRMLREQV